MIAPTDAEIQAVALRRCVRANGHLLWQGPLGHGRHPRYVYRSRDYRLRAVWWRASGRPLAPQETLRNVCGEVRCVEPACQAVGPRNGGGPRPQTAECTPKGLSAFLRALQPDVWRVWPAEPVGVPAPCYACRERTLVRPGYLPYCDACAEKLYARQGAAARRDLVARDGWR